MATQLSLLESPSNKEKTKALEVLNSLQIEHLGERQFDTLSGGEKQLVSLARAIIQNPAILIMDEPDASLDIGNQIKLLTQINRLKDSGMTFFISTHHPKNAQMIADTVVLSQKKYGIKQGNVSDMLLTENLADLYGVSIQEMKSFFTTTTIINKL